MRKFLMFLITLGIIGLLFVGFKSYMLFYYRTSNINASLGQSIIKRDSKVVTNVNIEKLNIFIDPSKYTTKDKEVVVKYRPHIIVKK